VVPGGTAGSVRVLTANLAEEAIAFEAAEGIERETQ
jgi:hypothetical protein